jgi:hypothetical protein
MVMVASAARCAVLWNKRRTVCLYNDLLGGLYDVAVAGVITNERNPRDFFHVYDSQTVGMIHFAGLLWCCLFFLFVFFFLFLSSGTCVFFSKPYNLSLKDQDNIGYWAL